MNARTALQPPPEVEPEQRVSAGSAAPEFANRRGQHEQEVRSQFLAATCHELRTPLNAILGFAELLLQDRDSPCSPSQADGLRAIQSSGTHMLSLIHDLLNLARLDAGPSAETHEEFDGRELVEEVARMLRPIAQGKALRLELQLPERPATLVTDRRALRQILLNFAGNAIKFTIAGTVWLQVAPPDAAGGMLEIAVADTGMGFTAEQGHRLFRPYSRLESRCEGTGLGLYLSRQLAERLGGFVGFSSVPGAGSRFWIRLPQAGALAPARRGMS